MSSLILRGDEDIRKLVLGATLLGTGGGGDPREGFELLSRAVRESGGGVEIIDLDQLSGNGYIVSPYYVGSIAPGLSPRKSVRIRDPIEKAFEVMERVLGAKIVGVIASEIGGFNTSVAMSIAIKRGLPVVNGDLLGRAAPELHQCTVHIFGYSMTPSVLVTETGNVVIVREYADIDDYEAIARYLSVLGGRFVAVVDTPLNKEAAEKVVVRGTIEMSYKLGEEIINSKRSGRSGLEIAERLAKLLRGWVVFQGVVDKYSWRDEKGFLRGELILRGVGRYSGRVLKSWIMNEHIMIWIDEQPLVMPPDLFTLITSEGDPVTNSELRENMNVIGIAAPAPSVWRTEKGLELFGPRHFGFNYDYVPVEELVVRRGVI